MKLVRVGDAGREDPAVLGPDGRMLVLPPRLGDLDGAFLARGSLIEVRRLLEEGRLEEAVPDGVRVGAPLARPEKVICIGLNYRDHVDEAGAAVPTEPIVFLKAPNAVVGPFDEILIPRGSTATDWEVELGVVIGAPARYLDAPEDAASVIAGYCASNDVSERAFQLERGGQWTKGKSAETFNPLGPWFVSADEVPDPQNLRLTLSVNGVTRQDGNTRDMIFDVHYLVWYLSQFMVLSPGDVINTGTPAGVAMGHDDAAYLAEGDLVELSVEGLGTQRCRVAQA